MTLIQPPGLVPPVRVPGEGAAPSHADPVGDPWQWLQAERSGQLTWEPPAPLDGGGLSSSPPPPPPPPRTPEALLPASVPLSSPWSSPSTPDIRACTSNPCANNGTCANLDNGQYECSCPPGFSGKDCQKKDGPCVMNG